MVEISGSFYLARLMLVFLNHMGFNLVGWFK